jgi:hypothetical protein
MSTLRAPFRAPYLALLFVTACAGGELISGTNRADAGASGRPGGPDRGVDAGGEQPDGTRPLPDAGTEEPADGGNPTGDVGEDDARTPPDDASAPSDGGTVSPPDGGTVSPPDGGTVAPSDATPSDTTQPDTTPSDAALPDTSPPDGTSPDTTPPVGGKIACTASTAPSVCPTGSLCIDGWCCDTACTDVCAACDVPGREGTCSPRPAGFICRESAGVCDAQETCDGLQTLCPADAPRADGTVCGAEQIERRCSGTGCGEQVQQRATPSVCTSGVCGAGTPGDWTAVTTCGADAICVESAGAASCQTCSSPPAAFCDGQLATNWLVPGRCAVGACAYDPIAEDCGGTCEAGGGTASCSSCNRTLMAIPQAPLWGWETGNEDWSMTGDWGRRTGSSARTGRGYIDTNPFDWEYRDSRNDRNRWNTSRNLAECASCPMQASVWVRGSTETNFDYVQMECSPNGGSSWQAMGARITGRYNAWTQVTRDVPPACLTTQTRFAMRFVSDFTWSDQGYLMDDFRLHTTPTPPTGVLDGVGEGGLWGWTCDADAWSDELQVRLVFRRGGPSGPAEERWVRASTLRTDLIDAGVCGGTGNHGYSLALDEALLTWLGAGTHELRAFAVDGPGPCGAGEYELANSPRTFTR